MSAAILIIEPRHEVAEALRLVVTSAHYRAIVRPYLDQLSDLGVTPAAVIVRISFEGISEPPHAVIGRLPLSRPPVIAIASTAEEAQEAQRLKCDVILHAPAEINQLCDVLNRLVLA